MSVVFSGTNQGVFTADGNAKILQLRSDVDWIRVYNQTQIAANAVSTGYEFYWQRGMADGTGIEYKSNAGGTAVNLTWLTSGGFTLINNTVSIPGALTAVTSISNATPPVVATGSTANLSNGDVIRLFNITGAQQLGGLDFTIGGLVANTSFTLAFMRAIAAATTGNYRKIPFNPYFYPPTRVISKIRTVVVNGSNATQVTMTVTHNYTVGQAIRFDIPTVTPLAYGMPALNGVQGNIIAINTADVDGVTNTITVDVDSSTFGTFAWPLTTNVPFTPAQIVPVGENTAVANAANPVVNPFLDAEINQGFIGISLAAGVNGPAGQANDVIFWVAGKSFNA